MYERLTSVTRLSRFWGKLKVKNAPPGGAIGGSKLLLCTVESRLNQSINHGWVGQS